MVKEIIEGITGTVCPIRGNDIDTDAIIPGRFLNNVVWAGIEDNYFYDLRFNDDGSLTDFSVNNPNYNGSKILVVNKNFGCGSSREHAPQSMKRYGHEALIGESFAEIFQGNCRALGMPVVAASEKNIYKLQNRIEEEPSTVISIDLVEMVVNAEGKSLFDIDLPEGWKETYLNGTWDPRDQLIEKIPLAKKLNECLPYRNGFRDY